VCADRIYTVAGNDREDMVRWATVLTLVVSLGGEIVVDVGLLSVFYLFF
jgi:hypothetical protein